MTIRLILLAIPTLVVLLAIGIFLYGNAHKRRSTAEEFAAAERNVFLVYGANPIPRFVTLRGLGMRAHYLEQGEGRPLLAIHGGNSMSASWAPLVATLARNSRLIMVDRPGCGLTDMLNYRGVPFRNHSVEFTRDFLDSIGVRKTSIIGNSMGGYFALAFALEYPDRVDKLILIGATPMINDGVDLGHRILGIPGLNRWIYALQATKEALGLRLKPPAFLYARPERLRPEFISAQRSAQALPGPEESWLTMVEEVTRGKARKTYILEKELVRIQAPTLFVIGAKDSIDTTGELPVVMPSAKKVIIPNAAHIAWVDDLQACERTILEFLNEVSEPAANGASPSNSEIRLLGRP